MRVRRSPTLIAAVTTAAAALTASTVPALGSAAAAAPALAPTAAPLPQAAPPAGAEHYDRIGVRRGTTFLLRDSLDGGRARTYREGSLGWIPVTGDTDGNGISYPSQFRNGVWSLREYKGQRAKVFRFGRTGDVPVLGDWNRDGRDTVGIFRQGRWFLRDHNSPGRGRTFVFGKAGDVPVVGDWNGDGRTDIGIRRGSTWYLRNAPTAGKPTTTFTFGSGGIPIAGDWDHDGRDTVGLFHRGSWAFRDARGRVQRTAFGRAGDRPFIRRTRSLGPGLSHRVVRRSGAVAHVLSVNLSARTSVDPVLAAGRLGAFGTTSRAARRAGALAAVNGDFFTPNGRPSHVYAQDGELWQSGDRKRPAIGLDLSGTQVSMGLPQVTSMVQPDPSLTTPQPSPQTVSSWNENPPLGDQVVGHTPAVWGIDGPPAEACYAGTTRTGPPVVRPDGTVDLPLRVTSAQCGGAAPSAPDRGALFTGLQGTAGETFVRSLTADQNATLTQQLGFPGAIDLLGGNPMLVAQGVVQTATVARAGDFYERHPRTAVGVTGAGQLLLVVVDGRQPGYSGGMTLVELAELMRSLGAHTAMNLDGGGSATMFANGIVLNRPSDGRERAVVNALLVLPGADAGQAQLTAAPRPLIAPQTATRMSAPPTAPAAPDVTSADEPVPGAPPVTSDPASTGGLADALEKAGEPLPEDLQQADEEYDAAQAE